MSQLSLTIGQDLWRELLAAALPIRLVEGDMALVATARQLAVRADVGGRVRGLLGDRRPPDAVRTVSERALASWRRRRAGVYRRLGSWIRIDGRWRVEVDGLGTSLRYETQALTADAWVRGVAEGVVLLLDERVEFPFTIERRVGASVALRDLRYDPQAEAVIGSLADLGLHIGDSAVLQLLSRLCEAVLGPRLEGLNPVTVVTKEAVEGLLGGLAGAARVDLGVEDLDLVVADGEATLHVRLGFRRARLAVAS